MIGLIAFFIGTKVYQSLTMFHNVLLPLIFQIYFLLTIICLFFREKVYFANIYLGQTFYLTALSMFIWKIFQNFLIQLTADIELNPGPKPKTCTSFSVCHWNLNSISSHNFINYCLLLLSTNLTSQAYLKLISIRISL